MANKPSAEELKKNLSEMQFLRDAESWDRAAIYGSFTA
ncbi:methionine sulfoxide reductase B [Escherichia coli]|uniref:Methionine sulfoxide reductase B n=1 Tax=Escherichia coli TaxID=562 RepID=A0A376RHX7_ECOLX|nr:methionine sulfoxide reductase B [Escherichia coli]